jgi:tetratricopeptide (TPR) repeat protein
VINSFGTRALFDRTIPSWTRPLVFPPNVLTQGLNQQVLMLRVAPGQSEIEGRYHLARFVRFVEGKPDVAMEVLEQILKQAPASSLARVEYADLLASKGRFDQAIDELKLALKDADAPTREGYTRNFVNGLMSARQYKPLTSLLRNVAAYSDATPGTILQSAWLLATLPDEDARDGPFALGLVEGLEKSADGNPELVLAKAAAHAATGDFTTALAALDEPNFAQKANPEQQQIAASLRLSYQQGKVWSHEP